MRILRRLSPFGRVAVALAILAAVGFASIDTLNRAARQTDNRRSEDRRVVAKGIADQIAPWLNEGVKEATSLAMGGSADMALEGTFGSGAMVFESGSNVGAASGLFRGLHGRSVAECPLVENDDPEQVHEFLQTVEAVRAGASPGGVRLIEVMPGACGPAAAAFARSPDGRVAVVVDDLAKLTTPSVVATGYEAEVRVLVVDPAGSILAPGRPPTPRPSYLDKLALRLRDAGDAPITLSYPSGPEGDVLGIAVAMPGGWGVVLEQDAATFAANPFDGPNRTAVGGLIGALTAIFALVTWFDVRRRRAAGRAEAERNAFLAIVGHELRTPLTVIKGYTETLASRWDALDDSSRQMLVENMAPQAQRQARVVEHLLTAAAIQAGTNVKPVVEPLDPVPVIKGVVAEYERLAPLHRFRVEAERDLAVQANSQALAQIVSELLDNAVRFSPSGGDIDLRVERRGRSVQLLVDDEGVGLPSDIDRLFVPFSQGEDVDKRLHAEGGIGVGLFIVRALVHELGGKVSASHREPRGARFVVELRGARALIGAMSPHARGFRP
jgi:signal transduction histidine kinase